MSDLAALRDRRLVECVEPSSNRPWATAHLKSIASPFGDIGRVAALGMNARRTRSETPSLADPDDERRYYGIRGNLTQTRCGLPSVCLKYDDVRRISEGGTASQKSLLRNNFRRFSTREAAQEVRRLHARGEDARHCHLCSGLSVFRSRPGWHLRGEHGLLSPAVQFPV